MSNLVSNLAVPSANGAGAAVNVALLGIWKTFVLTGTLNGLVTVEVSNDGVDYVPLFTFQRPGTKTVRVVTRFLRAVVSGYLFGSAVLELGAQGKVNNFETLDIPASDGVGASTNVNSFGGIWSIIVKGNAFKGTLNLEVSQDSVAWSPVGRTFTNDGIQTIPVSATWVRVRRAGFDVYADGPPTIGLGMTNDLAPGGGGVYPPPYVFPLNNITDFGAVSNGDPALNRQAVSDAIDDAVANDVAGIFVPGGVFGMDRNPAINASIRREGLADFLFLGLGPKSILRMEGASGGFGSDWSMFFFDSARLTLTTLAGNGAAPSVDVSALPRYRIVTFEKSGLWNGTATLEDSPDGLAWTSRAAFTVDTEFAYESTASFARIVTTGHSAGSATIRYTAPSQRVWAYGVVLDGSGVTNPGEQTHLWQMGGGDVSIGNAVDFKLTECIFEDVYGDAIRLLGAAPLGTGDLITVDEILVDSCHGFNNRRTFFSIQRGSRRVALTNSYADDGEGQLVDFEPTGGADQHFVIAGNIFSRGTLTESFLVAISGTSSVRTTGVVFARNVCLDGNVNVIYVNSVTVEDNIIIGHPTADERALSINTAGEYILAKGNVAYRTAPATGGDIAAINLSGTTLTRTICEDNIAYQLGNAHIVNVEGTSQLAIRRNLFIYASPVIGVYDGIAIRATVADIDLMEVDDNEFFADVGGGRLNSFVRISASPRGIGVCSVRDNGGTGASAGVDFNTVGSAPLTSFFATPPLCKNHWSPTADFGNLALLLASQGPSVLQAVCIGGNRAPGAAMLLTQVGSPAGVFPASPGSLYFNRSGGAATTLYVKESLTTAAGWIAK